MMISENTKAILLLTAPLLLGRSLKQEQFDLLKPKEYHQFALYLRDIKKQPEDLLSEQVDAILDNYSALNKDRILQLLGRGFLLSQVLDYWQSRGIWVISRADENYPNRLKNRLKEHSPAILYGCGNPALLEQGGLAVVGSRNVNNELITYTETVGASSAEANKMVISGGAQGIDSIAMHVALNKGGAVCGVLADNLEKAALSSTFRNALYEERLVLISAFDPKAAFNVGNAMQRNKYIYALADAALIVNADLNKGGTWNGAIEQLTKYQHIPVYIRATGEASAGLNALKEKGALLWQSPRHLEEWENVFSALFIQQTENTNNMQMSLLDNLFLEQDNTIAVEPKIENKAENQIENKAEDPKEILFQTVRQLIKALTLEAPKNADELAEALDISLSQLKIWLTRLVQENVLTKQTKPIKYIWNNLSN